MLSIRTWDQRMVGADLNMASPYFKYQNIFIEVPHVASNVPANTFWPAVGRQDWDLNLVWTSYACLNSVETSGCVFGLILRERETEKTSELPSIAQRVNNSSVYKAKVFHWHFGERERIKAGFITKAAVRNDFGTTLQLDHYLIIATTLKRLDNASDEICLVYFNTKLS